MSQALIMHLRFSLEDPCYIHCKKVAILNQHQGRYASIKDFAVASSLSPPTFLITFKLFFVFRQV